MTTIIEDYVSFETAKLLKEKGFNEQTRDFYSFENNIWIHRNTYKYNYFNLDISIWENCYSCPTLQMTMKWLLKKYNIFICILFLEESNGFGYTIEDIVKNKYIITSKNSSYKEIEDACEAAIKYSLEHLI